MLSASLLLTGCFPVYESIYRPEALGGSLVETMCHYNSGPGRWDEIEFVDGKVKSRIRAIINHNAKTKEEIEIRLSILIPADSNVQFLSNKFIFLGGNGLPQTLEPGDIHSYPQVTQSFDSKMTGGSIGQWKKPKMYYVSLTVYQAQSASFFLELPDLLVDGETFHFSKIHFIPEVTTYLATINC